MEAAAVALGASGSDVAVLTPSRLAKAVGISVPYASQILSSPPKRVPTLALAIRIFRTTGHKVQPIADATDEEIAVLDRFKGTS